MIRALLSILAFSSVAHATTTFGSLSNQSIVTSTSGVIGSVSIGNAAGKTTIFVSSTVVTAGSGQSVVLSSRTTTNGKTFYLQYFDVSAYENQTTTSTIPQLGSFAIGTGNAGGGGQGGQSWATVVASMTFTYSGIPPMWKMEFPEPIPIASGFVLTSSVTARNATSVTWSTNMIGYEK